MTSHAGRNRFFVLASVLVALGAGSCSKSSPTAPYGGGYGGGGGGGGTGTAFNFGPFAAGQSAKQVFANAGSFGYHCIPHQSMGMVASVLVDAAGVDSQVVQIGATGLNFTPAAAHIKTGGYVRWVNASSFTNHTVTSN